MEMTDKRIALPDEYQFRACNKIINIKNEVGRGANCIVYDVIWEDTMGLLHLGRVKELYPIYLQMIRNSDNTLECDNENKFVEAQRRFCAAYKKNVQFKNMHGLSNSTINASEIFEMNGTYYVMMNMDEGIDYRKYSDKSLIETFKHIKALANVIKKYHEVGYLHLDVKPENVYVIPETAEHIYLFDFDSICKISELQEKNIIELSYSEGFSAPEQVQSDISKIGVKTDIYAIGAVLFYKLFNRKPTFEERRYSAHFIYKDMVFYDEALRPAFFKKLDLFLHKTLSSAVSLRWNTMDKVITALDELIELANLEDEYLIDTFTYNSSCFVGRSDELEKIHYTMGLSNVLFLSGIGGIGKTELAKKYVSEYRGEYDTVAFVYFNESIEHTVCHEMLINNMSIDEEESEKDYFERVLEVLRKTTSDKDLILLDNFDVVKDNRIEDLLKCPCKFLITTRNRNIRDWNFNEIKIDRMDSNKDLMLLFLTYNDEKYEKQEYEKIESLINFVDGHTMTVELISKYLRDTGQKPSFLYQQFMDKSGVTNTDDELVVNQRKDFNMNSENVNAHLSILFDVFGFDSASKEIISSLSLFAGIKIIRDRFEKLCKVDNVHENLDRLIRGGWIEINEKNGKISLHQVIQDLIFTKLLPTSTNCPNIVDGMYAYINENIENYSETRIRRRVFDIFSERLSGNDIPYARICLKSGKEYKIDEAINICNSVDSLEANSLLTELYMKRIEKLCACEGIWEIDLEYGKNYILKIYEQYLLAIESCRKSTNDPKELVPRYIMLGNEMDSILSSDMITVYYEDVEELDLIYQKIIELYENAGEQLQKLDIPYAEKEKLYRIICNFYSDGDYSAMYRSEHYANIKKLYKYQELLEKLIEGNIAEENRDDDRKIIYVDPDIKSYSELADMCMSEGDYETAIEMYKKGYEDGTEPFELVCSGISKAYIEMGDTRKAIKCLECVLENDKKCIANGEQFCTYSSYICIDLIKILIDCSRVDEAKKYAKELVMYKESEMCDGEKDEYLINKLLTAYWYLYLLEENEIMKSEYWNKCKCLFDLLDSMEIDEELYSFVLEYIDKEEIIDSQILAIVDRLDRWNVHHEEKKQIIHKIDQLVVKKGVVDL